MAWRIHPKTKAREQITTAVGDIWQDDRAWKIRFPKGIHTETTKRRCTMWRRQMVRDGLIPA